VGLLSLNVVPQYILFSMNLVWKRLLFSVRGPDVIGPLQLTGPDKMHDKKADEAAISYPRNATLDKDTGLQGYEPAGVITRQPKKPKGKALGAHPLIL
jgi:hypothetical protein